jgi:RecJ-like exonuclease
MNKTWLSFLILSLLLLLIICNSSSAMPDHKTILCANCHQSRIAAMDEEGAGDNCDGCHNIKDNIDRLEQTHSQICGKCHPSPETPEAYHQMHSGISCEKCHGNGTLPVKPGVSRTNCAGCHGASVSFNGGGKIHEVHKAKLESACPKCHGARPSSEPSIPSLAAEKSKESKKEIISIVYAKMIDYRKYTLYEIFRKLSLTF